MSIFCGGSLDPPRYLEKLQYKLEVSKAQNRFQAFQAHTNGSPEKPHTHTRTIDS